MLTIKFAKKRANIHLCGLLTKFFMNSVKNIIFDFGGVIIDIDFNKSIEAYNKLGAKNFKKFYSQAQQTSLFDKLDTGEISLEQFLSELRNYLPPVVTNQQMIDAWNAILIGIPEQRIRMLERLKEKYRLFLLSNTNEIHYPEYTKELQEKYHYENLSELFEKVYLSFEVGLRKPDAEIYKMVLLENNLDPKETLFIDDSIQNLKPAEKLGIRTCFLAPPKDIVAIFDLKTINICL